MVNKNQFKIYADEDSIEFGKHLKKECGLNVILPKNSGKSIPDETQLRLANSDKAFILTKNKRHFLNIANVFDKIGDGGIIIWNTKDWRDICDYILNLCKWRQLCLKGKIFILNNEGVTVVSKKGKSKIDNNKYPCALCQEEKCKIREGNFLH